MRNERYYYGILPAEKKKVYKSIYDGINRHSFHIKMETQCSQSEIQDVYQKVLCDHPPFFFINQRRSQISGSCGCYTLIPEYIYDAAESRAISKDIRRVVAGIMVGADQYSNDKFRLEKYLHDSVVKSVAYDYDALKAGDCYHAHSIVGAFLEKKAVCEGISKAFKLLCNMYGMKCMVVLGRANSEGDVSQGEYHAWNMIKIGEDSYHVDVTWDNVPARAGIQRYIRYDYFNLTTQDILLDHLPIGNLPQCTATKLNYYYGTGSFVRSFEDLKKLLKDRLRFRIIMFKVTVDAEFENMQQVAEITEKTLVGLLKVRFQNGSFSISVNAIQRTVIVRFLL